MRVDLRGVHIAQCPVPGVPEWVHWGNIGLCVLKVCLVVAVVGVVQHVDKELCGFPDFWEIRCLYRSASV